jgi:hypothetical protein
MMDDLKLVIDSHFRSLITDRGDGAFAHVSDCFGCDYATWARRQGNAEPRERDAQACLKMQLGVEIERYVCDALQAWYEAQGYGIYRDYGIVWDPEKGRGVFNEGLGLSPTRRGPDAQREIVGHADLVAWRDGKPHTLIEVKSTSFLKGRIPTEPSPHYVEQAATYGIAVGATHCGIVIVCRESGRIAGPFWLDLDALEFATIERAKAVLEKTSGLIPPRAEPRYSWQPRYCALAECACAAASLEEKLAASIAAKEATV